MNQEKMRWWPIECTFADNVFAGNKENIQFRVGWGKDDLADVNTIEYFTVKNNRDIDKDIFSDANRMDFRIKDSVKNVPGIPFEKIGLYSDEYRRNVPDKAYYRNAIKEKFSGRRSYDEEATYDPSTISDVVYFNTGKLLLR